MVDWISNMPGNIAVPLIALAAGLLALWPMRSRLGAWGYALSAFPVGLVGWGFVPVVSTLLGEVTRWRVIAPVLVLYVAAVMLAGRWSAPKSSADEFAVQSRGVAWWVALITMGVGVFATRVFYEGGWSIYSGDSWSNYQMFGQILVDTGRLNIGIITNRGLILPALHGASTFIGGSWTFVIYPLMAFNMLGILAFGVAETAFDGLKARYRLLGTAVTLIALVSTAAFIFHTFYVHSHMVSALGMLLALVGIQRAYSLSIGNRAAEELGRRSWLIVASLGALLFALARPDGIAYMFVLFLVFAFAAARRAGDKSVPWKEIAAFFVPVLMGILALYGALFITYGIYSAPHRLGGAPTLAIMVLAAAVPWLIHIVSSVRGLRVEMASPRGMLWVSLANCALFLLAIAINPDRFDLAGATWLQNLFLDGGWNRMWWFGVAVIAGTLIAPESLRRHPWGRILAYALFQFLAVAILVHAVTHPGRLGSGDSLNRVTFHAVPLLFWLAAMLGSGAVAMAAARTTKVSSGQPDGSKRS